jgi:hypothetical protein
MSPEVTQPLERFLRTSADARIQDKWISILRKPASNWKRLDVFELWMRNERGDALSRDFEGAKLVELAATPAWSTVKTVHLYLLGRNAEQGHLEVPLLAALSFPMVEGVAVAADNGCQAFCLSHEGDIRVFDGGLRV